MVLKVIRFVNLFLAGNEVGTWSAVHPALGRLGTTERIRAEQELTRRYAVIMPFWMGSAVLSCVAAAAASRGSAGFRNTLAGAACYAGVLVSTRIGNVSINDRVLELSPEKDQAEFARLRERWDRLHALRVALNAIGLGPRSPVSWHLVGGN